MNIKVIQCVETGEYLQSYCEEYPFVGWWYHTKDISEAIVFRNTFYAIDVMKMLRGSKKEGYFSVEFDPNEINIDRLGKA